MVRLWDRASGKPLHSWSHPTRILSVAFSPDGKLILAGGDGFTYLWTQPRARNTPNRCPTPVRCGRCASAPTAHTLPGGPGATASR